MRNLQTPTLPETKFLTDSATIEYAKALNVELDSLRRELNKYVGRIVLSSITAATTLGADDELVLCNGTFTVTLPPAASSKGKIYVIKNIGSGTITIDGDGSETIDGATTQSLSAQYDFIAIASNGTEWLIVADMTFGSDKAWFGSFTFGDTNFIIFDKASGNGIKVDTTTPTFGWADLQGVVTNSKGATKATEATYRGGITEFQFSDGADAEIEYHIPHDYVKGTDIHLHVHWSHIGTLVTGGTLTFTIESSYAKGHNQAAFSAPVTGIFTGTASTTQYQHIVSETQYSASSPSGLQIDTDDLEPDGIILMRFEMTTNNITVSGGAVPDPFIHHIDVHYQTTGLIGTKDKAPDFYA